MANLGEQVAQAMQNSTEADVRSAMSTVQNNGENNPWPGRLDAWKKFSETYHDRGRKIEARYEDIRDANEMTVGLNMNDIGGKRVNMFYSNTTVIKESLFNSLPKPSVSRLHFGEWDNDIARVAALIVQRALTYQVKNAPFFEGSVKAAILDRLVPGIGSVWIEYKPAEPEQVSETGVVLKQAKPAQIAISRVYWKDLLWDPARSWEESTWAGRKLYYDRDKAKEKWPDKNFGEQANKTVKGVEDAMFFNKICVKQIWDKETREVLHMTETGDILDRSPDPYLLSGFLPTPKPLIASPPTRVFLPLSDYYMAQDQYLEMDILYARINLIIEAIRVAGVYDASQSAVGRMLGGTENKLIPIDNWAMFAERGGMKGAIDWYPVETVAQVLNHLVNTFSFIKSQLYEVTGMSDITRGSSNQYETAAAQQIKAQFASVRLNGYQRDVAKFVSETLQIIAELTVQFYTKDELSKICGQLPEADQQFVDPALQLLQNDFLSQCSISIEADSLTQADWGLEQQQRMTYVQALSQFIQSALPVAQQSPALAPLLANIAKFATVGFKGSSELEGSLDAALATLQEAAKAPKPKGPEEIKAETEQQKAQLEMQQSQADHEAEMQQIQAKLAAQQQQMELDRQKHVDQMQMAREEHALKMQQMQEEYALKNQLAAQKAATDIAVANAKAQQKEETSDAE